jgi:hypothetical protein
VFGGRTKEEGQREGGVFLFSWFIFVLYKTKVWRCKGIHFDSDEFSNR